MYSLTPTTHTEGTDMERKSFKKGTHATTTKRGEALKMIERIERMIKNTDDPARIFDLMTTLRYWKRQANK